jgi:hypothetical protein
MSGRPRLCPASTSCLRQFVPVLCPRGVSSAGHFTDPLDLDAAVFQPLFCGVLKHRGTAAARPEPLKLGHLGHCLRATVPGVCPGQSGLWDSGTPGTAPHDLPRTATGQIQGFTPHGPADAILGLDDLFQGVFSGRRPGVIAWWVGWCGRVPDRGGQGEDAL